jgi:hypothetical protein
VKLVLRGWGNWWRVTELLVQAGLCKPDGKNVHELSSPLSPKKTTLSLYFFGNLSPSFTNLKQYPTYV